MGSPEVKPSEVEGSPERVGPPEGVGPSDGVGSSEGVGVPEGVGSLGLSGRWIHLYHQNC